jgi:hypothetical protein
MDKNTKTLLKTFIDMPGVMVVVHRKLEDEISNDPHGFVESIDQESKKVHPRGIKFSNGNVLLHGSKSQQLIHGGWTREDILKEIEHLKNVPSSSIVPFF